jgi:hypothetical protein
MGDTVSWPIESSDEECCINIHNVWMMKIADTISPSSKVGLTRPLREPKHMAAYGNRRSKGHFEHRLA